MKSQAAKKGPKDKQESKKTSGKSTPGKWEEMNRKQRREMMRQMQSEDLNLEVVHPDASGIDIGNESHYVAVPPSRDSQPVRCFGCTTAELKKMAEWLTQCGIRTLAMQSTGVYWIAVYDILEEAGMEVYLVNARETKNLPGRKTDVQEGQWLMKLHTYGLLRNSFRPSQEIRTLRTYWRQRHDLVRSTGRHIQRMQKALTQMNIQLANVISDISGVTGQTILKAILDGQRDPRELAAYRDCRVEASEEEIVQALEGNWQEDQLFVLRQEQAGYEFCQKQITERQLVRAEENPPRPDYRAGRTRAELDELHNMVKAAEVCALDTEASDKDPRNAVLYGVAFSVRERQAVYVPLMQSDMDGVSQQEVRNRLETIFRIKTNFVGHNIKFDYLILRKHGMRLRNIHFDTMLASGECFGDWDFFNLREVARRLLGTKIKRYGDIIKKEQTFLDVPFKDLVEHACTDADISLRLFHRLSVDLRNRQLEDGFLRDRMRTLVTLAEMECEGVRIDVKKIEMSINRLVEDADA